MLRETQERDRDREREREREREGERERERERERVLVGQRGVAIIELQIALVLEQGERYRSRILFICNFLYYCAQGL